MRALLVTMMLLAVLVTGCKKKVDESQQIVSVKSSGSAAPVNTIIAPLTPEAAKSPNRILTETVFICDNKSNFTATFKPNQVEINSGWRSPAILAQQITASGFWYKNAQYDLRGKGRQVKLTVIGRKPLICSAKN